VEAAGDVKACNRDSDGNVNGVLLLPVSWRLNSLYSNSTALLIDGVRFNGWITYVPM
jgi:hypothetical protein